MKIVDLSMYKHDRDMERLEKEIAEDPTLVPSMIAFTLDYTYWRTTKMGHKDIHDLWYFLNMLSDCNGSKDYQDKLIRLIRETQLLMWQLDPDDKLKPRA